MADYITKERARDLIVTAAQGNGSRLACMLSKLEDEPPADVAPVIYGKWKFISGPDEDNNLQFMCDNCGAGDVHAADVTVPYCWKCGARMDGGDEE